MNPPTPPASRRTWPLRDRPGLVWLGLAAALTLVHRWVPGSGWLLVHLVLLGALTHSAMVWSTHFTQALLKTPADDRRPHPAEPPHRAAHHRGHRGARRGADRLLAAHRGGRDGGLGRGGCGTASSCGAGCGARCPGRFRITVRYYLAAAACLPVGATLGAWLARGLDDERHGAVLVAHSMVMVLGWIGLTVTGTLVTLWPTMLRTRMDDRAERLARQALPVLLTGLAVLATGAALGSRPAALAGLAGYAAGLAWWGRALVGPARQAPPKVFATWSVTAALGWGVVALAPRRVAAGDQPVVGRAGRRLRGRRRGRRGRLRRAAALRRAVPPHPLGARWRAVRRAGRLGVARPWGAVAGHRRQPRAARLPAPRAERRARRRVGARARRAGRVPPPAAALDHGRGRRPARPARLGGRRRRARGAARPADAGRGPPHRGRARSCSPPWRAWPWSSPSASPPTRPPPGSPWPRRRAAPSTAGVAAGAAGRARPPATRRGCTVEAHDMSYSPASLSVPYGDRLVIDLVNRDDGSPHDLTFGDGIQTGRVMPGRSATLDVGVVGASTQGWCRIVGHRQMGMVLDVVVTGAPGAPRARRTRRTPRPRRHGIRPIDAPVDLSGTPAAGFAAVPAALPPLDGGAHPRGDADHRGGRAGGGPRGAPEALDLQRHGARPHPARPGRRHLRGHPRQPRLDGPLGRLPRRRGGARRGHAHHRRRAPR